MASQYHSDVESTSASTVSTLRHPQQNRQEEDFQKEEQPQKYMKKKKRRSKPFLPPISSVRRISWDNISFDRDLYSSNGRSRSQKSIKTRSSGNTLHSFKGSAHSFSRSASSRSNPQESLNGRHNEEDKKSSKAVIIGRELFIIFILITAGVFGSMSYW